MTWRWLLALSGLVLVVRACWRRAPHDGADLCARYRAVWAIGNDEIRGG